MITVGVGMGIHMSLKEASDEQVRRCAYMGYPSTVHCWWAIRKSLNISKSEKDQSRNSITSWQGQFNLKNVLFLLC